MADDASVKILADDPAFEPRVDPKTGAISIDDEDGGTLVYLDVKPFQPPPKDQKHFDNLADGLDEGVATWIVEEVLRGVEADIESRKEWEETRAEGIKMLGTTLEKALGDSTGSSAPFEGMSAIRHPLLLEAVIRAQATTGGELFPPNGPVKVRDDRPSKPEGITDLPDLTQDPDLYADDSAAQQDEAAIANASRDDLAEALRRGFNHNLTVVDRGYRPDSVRMLAYTYFDGCAFKKVIECPVRRRPVSRFVQASDFIVSNATSDLRDSGRYTHRIRMRKALVKRMQIAGVYRKTDLPTPSFTPTTSDEAEAEATGTTDRPQRQEDEPYTIYESYVELDIKGHEHREDGEITGLPLPWKISIDKDSRQLLELRRNWEEDDETYQPRETFVKFGFVPFFGYYDLGFLNILGNGERTLTAAWREALDCGMFGNFPGFMYNEGVIRNWTNQNRVPPGGGIGIKGVPPNLPLRNVLEPLPYKDVGVGMIQMIQHVEQRMDRVAGTSDLPVSEGNAEAPVGTTLALIEQATKVLAAAHINLYGSLAEELGLLKNRYKDNPTSFWRWNKKGFKWEEGLFLRALEDSELVPAADPNTHSNMMRVMRAWAILQVAQQAPYLHKLRATARHFYTMIGVANPDEFLVEGEPQPPPPQPSDPSKMAAVQQRAQEAQQNTQAKMAELQLKGQQSQQEHQARMAEAQVEAQASAQDHQLTGASQAVESADRAADRASRERVAAMRLQAERDKLASGAQQSHLDRAADMTNQHLDRSSDVAQQREQRASDADQQQQQREHETQQAAMPKPSETPKK